MMNIVGCMDRPSSGRVILGGDDISKLNEQELCRVRRERIGLVFQQFHLINYLTALENVMTAQYYHSVPDEKQALQALAEVGLEKRANHLPGQLSGGEQQRVCIARALINYPQVILADEPTGNLDEANEHLVMDLFSRMHRDGRTVIVVTHDPEVAECAERTVILDHGRLTQQRQNGVTWRLDAEGRPCEEIK
ncbi:MAG: ABC transporter ATP-binding protein, partial [Proteobacteria bacterium]|nr:ABC transporter ATP-binding protein [Candidatus Avisuccinivibrio stercorigallinarum]